MHTFLFNIRASASGNLAISKTACLAYPNKDILFKHNVVNINKNNLSLKLIEIYLTKFVYFSAVKPVMKGRTTCPKCQNEFILDLPEDDKEHEVVCPKCKNKYRIQAKCTGSPSNKECSWEEHGEPRKTILSSIKPKTDRPTVAAIILICVFCLGITTAIFSDTFIETSLDLASDMRISIDYENTEFNSTVCTIILIIFSVFALLGTIFCLKRQHLDIAYAGSFLGIFSFGFFFIGSILCIIAFVLIRKSKDEFENGKKGRIF